MNTQNPAFAGGIDPRVSNVAAKAKAASLVAVRALIALAMVVLAIVIGIALPVLFSDWISEYPPAGLALGAAAILGVFQGLVATLPTLWDFIWSAQPKTLPKIFAEIAVAALGLGFAYYAVPAASESTRQPLNLQVAGSLPPVFVHESDAVLTTFIVFEEKQAVLAEGDAQITLINNLVDSLATCIQTEKDEVNIVVRAYASSSGTDSDNETLYKERTAYATALLQRRIDTAWPERKSRFKVQPREWVSLRVMSLRRVFKDTDEAGTYLEKAGALNRRADIRVRSVGSCLPD